MKQKLLFLFLLICLIFNPLLIIAKNYPSYFSKSYSKEYASLKKFYYSSQYVNKHPLGSMPDDTLEAFAGGIFLHGLNPILIVSDQPPLGRYITALSILLFDNEKTIPIFLLILSGLGIYLVSLKVIKNTILALIPFGIFINEPMFLHKFTFVPLLEPIQLPFIIFALYTCMIGIEKKRFVSWFLLTGILIGFVISIRYFVLGTVLTASMLTFLLIYKKFRMISVFICSLFLSLLVLLASYTQTFRAGYSLRQVLGIQKYIFVYHKSAFVYPFSFWDLLLFNKWHTWWGSNAILSDPEWTIIWPISILIILLFLIGVIFKKFKIEKNELILLLWITFYSLMLSVGYTSTRYFLPLIPFLYILATSFVIRLIRLGKRYVY